MNYARILLAGFGATVIYFVLGFVLFTLPPLMNEPAVPRDLSHA